MYFLSVSVLATLPLAALATLHGHCTGSKATGVWGEDGICEYTSTCAAYGGSTKDGACPSDPDNVKCCLVGLGPDIDDNPCGGVSYCDWTSNGCSGTWITGKSIFPIYPPVHTLVVSSPLFPCAGLS